MDVGGHIADGPEPFIFGADTTRPLGEHLRQVSKKIQPVGSEEMRYREKVYGRTGGRMYGLTPYGPLLHKLYLAKKKENNRKKRSNMTKNIGQALRN